MHSLSGGRATPPRGDLKEGRFSLQVCHSLFTVAFPLTHKLEKRADFSHVCM